MAYKQTYNPCDDCQYSFSRNNQESNVCKICEFRQLLDKPTADVVEVVRCKDCKNCFVYQKWNKKEYFGCCRNGEVYEVDGNHYCSYGERKE